MLINEPKLSYISKIQVAQFLGPHVQRIGGLTLGTLLLGLFFLPRTVHGFARFFTCGETAKCVSR